MKVVQTSKVYQAGRIALGDVMEAIGVQVGDYIQFVQGKDGRICIFKVEPPSQ